MQNDPSGPSAAYAPSDSPVDAIELLQHDHRTVQMLFGNLESMRNAGVADAAARKRIVEQICRELLVHAQIEEELFYPALRRAVPDGEVDQAERAHGEAQSLIDALQAMPAEDERFDATVVALGQAVMRHVQHEEGELFAQAQGRLDAAALGRQLMQRRQALQQETGFADPA